MTNHRSPTTWDENTLAETNYLSSLQLLTAGQAVISCRHHQEEASIHAALQKEGRLITLRKHISSYPLSTFGFSMGPLWKGQGCKWGKRGCILRKMECTKRCTIFPCVSNLMLAGWVALLLVFFHVQCSSVYSADMYGECKLTPITRWPWSRLRNYWGSRKWCHVHYWVYKNKDFPALHWEQPRPN